MNAALVLTALILVRLVVPFALLLFAGTLINKRQTQLY
jgi:hypothetical protein